MPIQLTCPQCDAKMRAPEAVIGKQVKCPKCQSMFLALDGPPPAPVAAPAVPPPAMVSAAPAPDPYAQLGPGDDEPGYRPGPRAVQGAGDVPGYRTLLSPLIGVHIVFWGGSALCLYYGLRQLVHAFDVLDRSVKAGLEEMVSALFILGVIPFMLRLQCEIFVVLYQILQTLRETRDRQK